MASDIGHLLRDARHRRGVTLSDAARATGVRETHLAALERDELETYGIDPVYIGGIVRTYADYLELDSVALLARYREGGFPADRMRTPSAPRPADRAADAGPGPSRVRRRSRRLSVVAVLVLLVVVAGAAAAVLTLRGERVDGVPTAAVEEEPADAGAEAAGAQATEASAGDAPSPASGASEQVVAPQRPAHDGLTMKLEFTRKVWVRVLADGRNVAEGIMRPGAVTQFSADEVIELRLGVPDAVEFSLNGAWYGAVGSGRSGPIDITCTTASSCDVDDAE